LSVLSTLVNSPTPVTQTPPFVTIVALPALDVPSNSVKPLGINPPKLPGLLMIVALPAFEAPVKCRLAAAKML